MEREEFRELGLSPDSLAAIERKGFEEPTEIQKKVIPILLNSGDDMIGQAQTGTGKTAAFGLPLLEKLDENVKNVQALIIVPTRELAIQVAEEINSLKGNKRITVAPIYGGQSIDVQIRLLRRGLSIVVGTPGRVIDHLERKTLLVDKIDWLVLDEADEMLNMGFIEDIERILAQTPSEKRVALFSATMPEPIMTIAKRFMHNFKIIRVERNELTTPLTEQIYFEVRERDKFEALCRIIDIEDDFYGLVFCRTKADVDELTRRLIERGYDVESLHGDISQNQRETVLRKFRQKLVPVLIATDVAARGIDITELSHVINFSLPQDPDSYVHRIGRTGRAGKEGTAITFVTPSEYRKLMFIQRHAKTDIRREKIPKIADIITSKKRKITDRIREIIGSTDYESYLDMARDLLAPAKAKKTEDDEENVPVKTPDQVVAALIRMAFHDELDVSQYGEISDHDRYQDHGVDFEGRTRLFMALGTIDGYGKREIASLVGRTAGIDSQVISEISVFDRYSFMTVPFTLAEKIIDSFKKNRPGEKPVIRRAEPPRGKSEGERPRGAGQYGRPRSDGGYRKSGRPADGAHTGGRQWGGGNNTNRKPIRKDRGRTDKQD